MCVCVYIYLFIYIYIHVYILFFTFFSLIDCYKILGMVLGVVHRFLLADAKFLCHIIGEVPWRHGQGQE